MATVRRPSGGVGRNAGLAQASPTSRYLLFLHADDELESSTLERFARELDSDPQLSMVHSLLTFHRRR